MSEELLLRAADLMVGFVLLACGSLTWRRSRPTGGLLLVTGVTWFAGSLLPIALFWHRGPLIQLLMAYPAWLPRSGPAAVVACLGYVVSMLTPVAWFDPRAVTIFVLAAAVAAFSSYRRARGRARHDRRLALICTCTLGLVLGVDALVQLGTSSRLASWIGLLVYETVVCAIAIGFVRATQAPRAAVVTDLVVDAANAQSGTLRTELANLLRDPDTQLGYWDADAGDYRAETGDRVDPAALAPGRVATAIDREGLPFAVLVHDPALLRDPELLASVAVATRLMAVNARRQADARRQVAEVAASRSRLISAADEESARLAIELRSGVQQRLEGLVAQLSDVARDDTTGHVARAVQHGDGTLADLRAVGAGLQPGELSLGLAAALQSLADAAPVPVSLRVTAGNLPPDVEVASYFVCTESVANVAKHAPQARVEISLAQTGSLLRVMVNDDGPGGAALVPGGGLLGLRDRIEALGGRLDLASSASGTRLVAELPLGDHTA